MTRRTVPRRGGSWTAVMAVLLGLVVVAPAGAAGLPYEDAHRVDAGSARAAAIEISQLLYPGGGAGAVVLARQDTFPDALGASALTTDVDGPLLLTPPDRLTADTRDELARLLPEGGTVFLLGGAAALHADVEDALDDLGYRTPRFPGQDRVQTAAMIARFVGAGPGDEALLVRASGSPDLEQGWVDSVSCGGYAAQSGTPILLTHTSSAMVAPESLETLDRLGVRRVHVCGGSLAVPDSQLDQLRQAGYDVARHAGEHRAATAVAVAEGLWDVTRRDGRTFLLVPGYGTRFGFGLVAAPLAAALDAPVLLVDSAAPTSCADDRVGATLCLLETGSSGAAALVAVGGTDLVSDDVLIAAARAADLPRDDQPPGVPAGVTATDHPEDDGTRLDITWTASTDESGPVTYRVSWRPAGSDEWATASTTETARALTGLTPETQYEITVDARDVFGNRSERSAIATATPTDEVPASPGDQGPTVVQHAGGGLAVSWIAAPEDDVVGYELQRLDARNDGLNLSSDCDPDNDVFAATWATIGGGILPGTSHVDTGVSSGTPYCYRYRPVDSTDNRPGFSRANGPVEAP